jgi:thioredoxin 1
MKKAEFQRRIKYSKKPLVVDLWAPWCAPCRAMQPAFKQASQKFDGRVEVLKINADESQEVLRDLGVMSIPTVIGFSGGNEIVRRTGMQSADMLNAVFEAAENGKKPVVMPPTPIGRIFRTLLGVGAAVAAWNLNKSIPLFILAAVLIFSAFYDRCPVYKALAPKIKDLFQGKKKVEPPA